MKLPVVEFTNSVGPDEVAPDEVAHNEPPHQDLHCFNPVL